MKVSNVSIVKSESFLDAVKVAITEFFNSEHAELVSGSLFEAGNCVFTSTLVDDSLSFSTRTTTDYFVCSQLPCGLVRVENCSNTEWVDK
mgnify:CR=1 FL=1